MNATARQATTTRTFLRLAWGMLVACLLASSLPALAANGRNPAVTKAAKAASAARAESRQARVDTAARIAQARATPAAPGLQR